MEWEGTEAELAARTPQYGISWEPFGDGSDRIHVCYDAASDTILFLQQGIRGWESMPDTMLRADRDRDRFLAWRAFLRVVTKTSARPGRRLLCRRCGHVWTYCQTSTASGTSCPDCHGYVSFTRDAV